MKVIERHLTWDVYYYWCWGNESEKIASLISKKEAQLFIAGKRKFDGFEGYDISCPYEVLLNEKNQKVFRFME